MRRNYTATKEYLLSVQNQERLLSRIRRAMDSQRTDGKSTREMERVYLKHFSIYQKTKSEVEARIDRVDDEDARWVLRLRYLKYKTGPEIMKVGGLCEKGVKSIHERGLALMEIILVEDGYLRYVDPAEDMMAEYNEGYQCGFREGYLKGRKEERSKTTSESTG